MDEDAKRNLRNVMVLAVADGELSEQESQFIRDLRRRLDVDEESFAELVAEVRQTPKQITIPHSGPEAQELLRLLAGVAAADRDLADLEVNLLHRLGRRMAINPQQVDAIVAEAAGETPADPRQIEALIREIYTGFQQWGAQQRERKLDEFAALGRAAVIPLLRMFESYRAPDGAPDALELKTMIAGRLGRLDDDRAAYYLIQQVSIGDVDDEISSAALRHAAAGALGRIVGESFGPDEDGVRAARLWWQAAGHQQYDRLAF